MNRNTLLGALLGATLLAGQSIIGAGTSAVAATPAAPAAARGRLPPGALRAQMVQIMDMNGFGQPLPAGWRAQGGVQWGQQFMCTNGYNFSWYAQSPDGAQVVAILPQARWESNNYGAGPSTPGCGSAPFQNLQQYLQYVATSQRQGARVLGFRPRPDLARTLAYMNQATPSPMGEMRTWVEAGEMQFAWQERGREMRGLLVASAVFSLQRNSALGNGQTMDAMTGFVLPGFAATGPAGEFNPQFAEAIRQSFVPNPGWQSAIAGHNTRIAQGAAAEVAKRGKIIAEYNDYVSLVRKEVSDARAKSDERNNRQFGELMRGTKNYDDADAPGGRVELSHMYDHAWRLNDGSYVLSNDASFDPWKDLGVEGRRLAGTQ
jgi:hypothetical protein